MTSNWFSDIEVRKQRPDVWACEPQGWKKAKKEKKAIKGGNSTEQNNQTLHLKGYFRSKMQLFLVVVIF